MWLVSWEDDLVMTNVRSFDVKAYDNAFAGYADLGWGDDLRLYAAVPERAELHPQGITLTASAVPGRAPNVERQSVTDGLAAACRSGCRLRHARPDVRARGPDAADHQRSSV